MKTRALGLGVGLLLTTVAIDAQAISFQNVTAQAGMNRTVETYGLSWGDFNGDGWPDLFVGNHGPGQPKPIPSLFVNQGNGTFIDRASAVIPNHASKDAHGAAWADFDNDGDQDLLWVVGRNVPNVFYVNQAGTLLNQASAWNLGNAPNRGRTPLWLDWSDDGKLDAVSAGFELSGNGDKSEIFERVGSSFQPRSQQTGFDCAPQTLFALLSDVSGDGKLDLICTAGQFPVDVYRTQNTPFANISGQLPNASLAHDVAVADFNGDQRPDFFVDRMNRPYPSGAIAPKYFQSNGGNFVDRTGQAGLNAAVICHSVVAGDFDNDTDVDLFRVCSASNRSNILYRNNGNGVFTTVANAGGAGGSNPGLGESAALADYDQDGFLDIAVTNGWFTDGPYQLFRNTSGGAGGAGQGNRWIQIDLEGSDSNPHGIGARLLLTAGGVTQLREQGGGMHLYSQNHQRVHFGLGSANVVQSLTIHWPSGTVQQLNNLAVNQVHVIAEDGEPGGGGGTAKIGDFVWRDNDGDGFQDAGEPGLGGVTVNLQDCSNNTLDTTTTSGNGAYLFDNLGAGDYLVEFVLPSDFSFSPRFAGPGGKDSDPFPTTGKTACKPQNNGQSRFGIDAGMVPGGGGGGGSAKIGDFVWRDNDGDGIQDAGEPGLGGVTVNLQDCSNTTLDTTTTSGNGAYLFDNLSAGDYLVEFVLPSGFSFSPRFAGPGGKDSDPFPTTGKTACKPQSSGQSRFGIDAGMVPGGGGGGGSAKIGDFVWRDNDGDGRQDAGEPGLGGVTVRLQDCSNNTLDTTTTSGNGAYLFDNLSAGDYLVEFVLPAGFSFSPRFVGSGGQDSDPFPTTGKTACKSQNNGQMRLGIDAGMEPQ